MMSIDPLDPTTLTCFDKMYYWDVGSEGSCVIMALVRISKGMGYFHVECVEVRGNMGRKGFHNRNLPEQQHAEELSRAGLFKVCSIIFQNT